MKTASTVQTKILIVEHDQQDLELLQYELQKAGINYVSEVVENETDYHAALKSFMPDIILSDYSLPSFDGATAFRMREQIAPDTPFIFISGAIGEESSIEFIKSGVTDYALKDKLFTVATRIKRALRESEEVQQKKKTAQELVQSERRLAKAQELAHMGSWELDLATNMLQLSDEAGRIFGFAPGENELSFEAWFVFIHPEDADFVLQTIRESRQSLKDTNYYNRIIRKDGSMRHIYSESKFEIGSNGKPNTWHGIVWDVTEKKLAEIERIKIIDELVQRNKDLEQFAYIVSHNLRSSVANVIAATKILNDPALTTEKKDILGRGIDESVTKLDNVIKDLNDILQVKRAITETKEKVCFSELVNSIKILIQNLIEKDNIEIKYDFSQVDELLTLKSYLYSIFYNLISNSIKYRRKETACIIEVKSQLSKDKIVLIFTDNGMGIDLQKKGGQVFGLYKRFHTNIEGKGMGLYMVKTEVETLGGKISIKSAVNEGTQFIVEFAI